MTISSKNSNSNLNMRNIFIAVLAAILVSAVIIFVAWSLLGGKSTSNSSNGASGQGETPLGQQANRGVQNNPPKSDQYLGVYRFSNLSEHPGEPSDTRIELRSGGKLVVWSNIKGLTITGSYSITGNKMHIKYDGNILPEETVDINGDTITDYKGKKFVKE